MSLEQIEFGGLLGRKRGEKKIVDSIGFFFYFE